jgi:hypothetical protein
MRRVRDLSVLLLTTAALVLSLVLLGRFAGFASPWLVLLAMLDFLGVVRVARPLFLLKLPRWLKRVRPFELRGGAYRAAGVLAFGALLRRTPLRLLNPNVYVGGSVPGFAAVCVEAESAEAAHLWAVVLTVPYLVYAAIQRWWLVLALFAAVHAVANLYPVLHLRLVRGRIQRALDRGRRSRAAEGHAGRVSLPGAGP